MSQKNIHVYRSYSANDVNREREEDNRKRIHVEGIEELEDETSDHERSGERQSGDDEVCLPFNSLISTFFEVSFG